MKKLCFLLTVLMASCLSANAIDYYLIGDFNSWTAADPDCKFTPQGDGSFILDLNATLTSGFKINDGTWENDNANFGGNATLATGVVYILTCSGMSGIIPLSENIANPHIVFNPAAKTLLITGSGGVEDVTATDDENAPIEYYNLNGIRIDNPSNGIFIRRQGNTVAKVIL